LQTAIPVFSVSEYFCYILSTMSFLYESRTDSTLSKQHAIAGILDRARPDRDYYLLLVGAILLAIGAIFTDSIPTLIASMIVAPLASPLLAFGLGLSAWNWQVMGRAIAVLLVSISLALLLSMGAAIMLQNDRVPDILISFNGSQAIAVGVAVISGIIAAYGTLRPKVGSVITGVAIAVSLMPPLVATGIGLAPGGTPFAGALSLFILNVAGVVVSSALTFWLLGMSRETGN
jgi:uncharacterized hydrophobic protein (TIGR00271 family)